jgi:uncharacterized protein (DUF2252 family)
MSPGALAVLQMAHDRVATRRFPTLLDHKRRLMLQAPHTFLRGSAPLFYEVLSRRPDLARGFAGEGWIVGDMHLENVGAYRTDDRGVVFDLNDFDDATRGPWILDALRLATSTLLAGRATGSRGSDQASMLGELLDGYARAAFSSRPVAASRMPELVANLMKRVEGRSARQMLDRRCPLNDGVRRFGPRERYLPLPASLRRLVPALLWRYVVALGERAPPGAEKWKIVDVAQRVAGTGSLGVVRPALLIADDRRLRLLDFKEARPSSCEALLGRAPRGTVHAERMVSGARALVSAPPRWLAAVRAPGGMSFACRRFSPQEDKLDLTRMRPGHRRDGVMALLGHLLGRAHARASARRPARAWSDRQMSTLLERASEMAGLFEAVYLMYSAKFGGPGARGRER